MKGGKPLWTEFNETQLKKFLDKAKSKKEFCLLLGYLSYQPNVIKNIQTKYPKLDFSKFTNGIKEDLTGKIFKDFEVLFNVDSDKFGHARWVGKCLKCGEILPPESATNIKNNHFPRCRCTKERISKGRSIDLTGKQFGMLKVIERDTSILPKAGSQSYWIVECQCKDKTRFSIGSYELRNSRVSCGCLNISKGEFLIKEYLNKIKVPYTTQFSFNDLQGKNRPLRFDFAVFNSQNKIKYLIEFQGEQHYRPYNYFGGQEKFLIQKEYDNLKREYCKNNNLNLIEIPFWEISNIEKILDNIFYKVFIEKDE